MTAKGFADASSEVQVIISFMQEITVALKPQAVQQTANVQGQASSITTEQMDTSSAVQQAIFTARPGHDSFAGAQLCQYRLLGAGHRARRAFRSHQSSHHRGFHRRQLRPEQRIFRGRR